MDKYFLLLYTQEGFDGLRHSCNAWFQTEEELRLFVKRSSGRGIEIDFAIEILKCRELDLTAETEDRQKKTVKEYGVETD